MVAMSRGCVVLPTFDVATVVRPLTGVGSPLVNLVNGFEPGRADNMWLHVFERERTRKGQFIRKE